MQIVPAPVTDDVVLCADDDVDRCVSMWQQIVCQRRPLGRVMWTMWWTQMAAEWMRAAIRALPLAAVVATSWTATAADVIVALAWLKAVRRTQQMSWNAAMAAEC